MMMLIKEKYLEVFLKMILSIYIASMNSHPPTACLVIRARLLFLRGAGRGELENKKIQSAFPLQDMR